MTPSSDNTHPLFTASRNPNYKGKNPHPYFPYTTCQACHKVGHSAATCHCIFPSLRHSSITCQTCNKVGHSAVTCPFLPLPHYSNTTPPLTPTSLSAIHTHSPPIPPPSKTTHFTNHHPQSLPQTPPPNYTPSSHKPDIWLLDSGATAHLTNQPHHLQNPHPYAGHDSVTVGNGNRLPITHTGHHTIITPSGQFHLPELLYVSTLKHNLLSVFHLTSNNNCSITFNSHGFSIHDKTTN